MTQTRQEIALSDAIEQLLVSRDLRQMKFARQFLNPGYIHRAAKRIDDCAGTIVIATGFPVADTFETDGPVGALALYQCLKELGKNVVIVCGNPLYQALQPKYRCAQIPLGFNKERQIARVVEQLAPELIIAIERPGLTEDNTYRNMRGEDISHRCARFDDFIRLAACPTIAIGDGGNEIGMGNIASHIASLDITPSVTKCDELIIADVSNWAAYGLIAFLAIWHQQSFLTRINTKALLMFLSLNGSVDGVTRQNQLTEDSLCFSAGEQIIKQITRLCEDHISQLQR
ncbi:glutamate cyclase domain-containing protein [Thalassotalea litorea]|uniref:glutamate cyclase domain-containing protein n=1 Tax=Thalassotalea litorea TaxID=2020715 RepID=UPI003736BFD0